MKERGSHLHAHAAGETSADGLLQEIPAQLRREAGCPLPVRVTPGVARLLTPSREERAGGQSLKGRVWNLLHCAHVALADAEPQTPIVSFDLMLGAHTASLRAFYDTSDGLAIHIAASEEC